MSNLEAFQSIAAQFRQLTNRYEIEVFDLVIQANNQLVAAYEQRIRQLEEQQRQLMRETRTT